MLRLSCGDCTQVGLTQKMVLSDYHPDAEHHYDMDMSLRNVIVALRDPSHRPPLKAS